MRESSTSTSGEEAPKKTVTVGLEMREDVKDALDVSALMLPPFEEVTTDREWTAISRELNLEVKKWVDVQKLKGIKINRERLNGRIWLAGLISLDIGLNTSLSQIKNGAGFLGKLKSLPEDQVPKRSKIWIERQIHYHEVEIEKLKAFREISK